MPFVELDGMIELRDWWVRSQVDRCDAGAVEATNRVSDALGSSTNIIEMDNDFTRTIHDVTGALALAGIPVGTNDGAALIYSETSLARNVIVMYRERSNSRSHVILVSQFSHSSSPGGAAAR